VEVARDAELGEEPPEGRVVRQQRGGIVRMLRRVARDEITRFASPSSSS
jgi:hypothetical protein